MALLHYVLLLSPLIPGLGATYWWWRAATLPVLGLSEVPRLEEGDVALTYEPGKVAVYRYAEQARMNRRAAAWTAAAVFLQALSVFAPAV